MRVLGIDPGYDRLGLAILEKIDKKDVLLFSVCLETNSKKELSERIYSLGKDTEDLINKWKPDTLAIEKLFFTTNQKTVMGVSEAKGVITYVAKCAGLKVNEYTPLQIKIAITGYGKSTKEQIMYMTQRLLQMSAPTLPKHDDEYDAIAVGLTCLVSNNSNYPQK